MNDNIGEILRQKNSPKLKDSFEDDLMCLIHEKSTIKTKSINRLKLTYMFIIMGIVIGIVASYYLQEIVILFGDYSLIISKQILFIPIIFGLLFVFEKAYSIYLFHKKSNGLKTLYKGL